MKVEKEEISPLTILEAVDGIALLKGVLNDPTAQTFLALLNALISKKPDPGTIAKSYSALFHSLAQLASTEEITDVVPDAWQAYLLTRLLDDVNPWSIQAERSGPRGSSPTLRNQAQRELKVFQLLFNLDAPKMWELTRVALSSSRPILEDAWVPWLNLSSQREEEKEETTPRDKMYSLITECNDWSTLVEPLTTYWSHQGTGLFARYNFIHWMGRNEGFGGIANPDQVKLTDLIGCAEEQSILGENIERFLKGLPAHDAILYGPPGTGKSSTVKALANFYANAGLRLIEITKDQTGDLPVITALLRDRAPRFLLFIDDLSFEEHEIAYKALKVLLEGSAEARPTNVLIYATTNRYNLIRENFSDRNGASEDVHWRDTMDEKVALVARFGLRVTFKAPDQEHYQKIVASLSKQHGLDIPAEELNERAITWERQHTVRSGRMARQFVDELLAEYGEKKKR